MMGCSTLARMYTEYRRAFILTAASWIPVFCLGIGAGLQGQSAIEEGDLTDLESFVVYEDPKIIDGSRRRPYTKRDSVVEKFFRTLPGIAESVYRGHLARMSRHLQKLKEEKYLKTEKLARLAGVEKAPRELIEGYKDRIDFLTSLLQWMKKQPPVELDKLIVWEERAVKLRLKRFNFPNLRLDPDSGEIESRIKLNWRIFYKYRSKSIDLRLDFDLGINLRTMNGYYDPSGFIFWGKLNPRDLHVLQLEYPIIVSQELRNDPSQGIARDAAAFRKAMDNIYQILTDFFFSDLSDLHGLYILARGRLFADEWQQFSNTPLARGLAAYLSFKTLEDRMDERQLHVIREQDWTAWNLRRIGAEFDDLNWENNFQPLMRYGRYKEIPRMENVFWSTRLVYYLIERFGPDFPDRIFAQMRNGNASQGSRLSEGEMFQLVTGEDLIEVMGAFTKSVSPPRRK